MVCSNLIGSDTAGQKLIGSTQLLAFLSCWTCFFPLENSQTQTATSKHFEQTNPLEYRWSHTFKKLSFYIAIEWWEVKSQLSGWLKDYLSKHLFHDEGKKNVVFRHFYWIVYTATLVMSFMQHFPLMGFIFRSSALEGVFLEVLQMCY